MCFSAHTVVVFLVAGLNTEVDRILEIACIITDGYLTKSVEVLIYLSHFSVIHDLRLRFAVLLSLFLSYYPMEVVCCLCY